MFGGTSASSTHSFGFASGSGFGNPPCQYCLSCRKDVRQENVVRICKQCLEGRNDEIKGLKAANEELKRQIEELDSKVNFLSWSSPVDHYQHHSGGDHEDDRCSCYAPDVLLIASDDDVKPVPAHVAILINKSPVFKAMLRNKMTESQTGKINISEVSYHDLCAFVNYLYTSEVNLVDDQRAQDLLAMGEKYEVKHLKAYCESFLRSKVNPSNALKYLTFATKYKAEDLVETSLNVIIENMNELKLQDEYKDLTEKDPHLVIHIYESYHEKKSS
ncbi:hypothetical protein Sjap_021715 [Stephania japonica]|uniref:BTB domain-containing protein n=1 Tax=Stephania japonica TaxID=461633 RepID=A0AAP0EUP0_9MAGN